MSVELRHHTALSPVVRRDLLDVYAEVRAPLLHLANYGLAAFTERLGLHAAGPGFELVLGYDGGRAVGYAYGNTVEARDPYWKRMAEPLSEDGPRAPVLALREIGVRPAWRGTGTARRVHDALLAGRGEERVVLMVNPLAGDGKVLRLYEGWGYRAFNAQAASAHSPRLTVMVRPTR
ncbi:GNAT family N-acetyltransferase [Kitasatospora sp. NPDC036755]|uniref:GNAT family N-acetyltransferase n=1 Tax=Kitasatospora sp. NPDC036755 TaxID=3154600 RepID=UPI0033D871FF